MAKKAKLILPDREIDLPVVIGTQREKAIDISKLRSETGYITLDPGYGNTGSCKSAITYINGEKGILKHRGYPIEELSEKFSFIEVAYLLIYGELPKKNPLNEFRTKIHDYSLIREDMKYFFHNYPRSAHPMAILSSMVTSLSIFNPELLKPEMTDEERDLSICHLLSKLRGFSCFCI